MNISYCWHGSCIPPARVRSTHNLLTSAFSDDVTQMPFLSATGTYAKDLARPLFVNLSRWQKTSKVLVLTEWFKSGL